MVRTLIALVILVQMTESFGQTEKGGYMVGGNLNIKKTTSELYNNPYTTIAINPGINYFLFPNLAAGLSIPYSLLHSDQEGEKINDIEIAFSPVIRYYIPIKKIAILFDVSYSLGRTSYHTPTIDGFTGDFVYRKIKLNTKQISFGAGITYFLNHDIGLEGLLKYVSRKSINIDDPKDQYIYPSRSLKDLIFEVGFQIYLARKDKNS